VWLHSGNHQAHRSLTAAIAERRGRGLPEPSVRVVSAPDRYLSGESSAVVRGLSGHPVLPAFRRTSATADGVHGNPTLVANVETLARAALLARLGPSDLPATSLVTVAADGRRTVLELDTTSTVDDALVLAGYRKSWHAVLLGGYGGSWAGWPQAATLPLAEPTLRRLGLSLGAGVIAPLPTAACGLAETARVLDYLAESGARQCGPCLFGLPALAHEMSALSAGVTRRAALRRLERYAGQVDGRGACHHPDGAVRLLRSALTVFADDVAAHLRRRPCDGARGPQAVLPIPEVQL
jgi:NADH:ubiquinone oxidoreductase subunit F (NADH-binding)